MNLSSVSSSAGLSHPTQPWTAAESAAGFVLRYLLPMREQLVLWLGDEAQADECLKRLIAHLVSQGFGTHGKGRIRDFLMRGIRSASKSVIADLPERNRPAIDFAVWVPDSPSWIANWRKGLLMRAWRSLERLEHKDLNKPFYTVLRTATEHPDEDAAMLAIRINTETDLHVEHDDIRQLLVNAKAAFASLLEGEIMDTLEQQGTADIQQEIESLGLVGIFLSSNGK